MGLEPKGVLFPEYTKLDIHKTDQHLVYKMAMHVEKEITQKRQETSVRSLVKEMFLHEREAKHKLNHCKMC